uniref:Ras and Rab interactor 2 n=1 Tax=Poecilia reticulata TaxID=8081 RepID=A0A3P9Q9B1_POERE
MLLRFHSHVQNNRLIVFFRLSEEVGRLFLQASPCPGMGPGPTKARDSGYDSLHRRLSVLERLMHTHSVWLQLGLSHQDAAGILQSQPAGSFLVRRSTSLQKKVISLRMDKDSAEPIKDFAVKESLYNRVLEKAMLKCVLKPLKPAISAALKEFQVRSGSWQELRENLSLAKARRPQEMGVADALPPDPVAIEKIRQKFQTMCKLYSPEKKVCMLLRVCKLIYTIMEDNSGRLYGADDFLPMLTYVLAQCDMPELDNEILYMMELLDPSLLHGEGGYYLTSAYGAMSLVKNFQEDQAARVLSSETRDTLHQWHRRRTTQRSAPSIDDFQNYLRVALQELDSGCTAKTLPVRPYTTVEELCQLCALKFKVSDPKNYGLFLQMEGSSQQLAADTHPQKIKAELHSRPQPVPFHFVYRRMTKNGTLSASLSSTPVGLSCLAVAPDPQANLNHQNTDPQALCGGSISV